MRRRKRLRKKIKSKKTAKAVFDVSLEIGATVAQSGAEQILEQFKAECLQPFNLSLNAKPTTSGWNGTIDNLFDSPLTEEHRGFVADWAFKQEEINSYCVGQLQLEKNDD